MPANTWRLKKLIIPKGDLAGAQKIEKESKEELHQIAAANKNLNHDRKDLSQDRNKDVVARNDERHERKAAIAKRNHDASKI